MAQGFSVSEPQSQELFSSGLDATVRIVDHSVFGRLIAPETPTDLLAILSAALQASSISGWRGQGSLAWRIDSSLVRRVRAHRQDVGDSTFLALDFPDQVTAVEKRLLERARLAGHGKYRGRTLSDLELSAVLQHHGAATRLLDCTANVFVALWFACQDALDDFGMLAAFDVTRAVSVSSVALLETPMHTLLERSGDTFGVWRPQALTPRIAAQQGFFVFSNAIHEEWGSVRFVGETLAMTGRVPGLSLFAINPGLKRALRTMWPSLLGYTAESLFPDLDGFARTQGSTQSLASDLV